jgi:hypothetical protein
MQLALPAVGASVSSPTATVLLAICLSVTPSALSQTANRSPTQDLRATQLLAACYVAMGSPPENFGVSAAGTIADSDHPQLPARQISMSSYGRRFFRSEEEIDGQKLVLMVGKRQATQTWRGATKPLSLSESALRTPELIAGFNCKLDKFRAVEDVSYVGQETRNGVVVDHLRFSSTGDPSSKNNGVWIKLLELDLYLDAQTHFIAALRRETFSAVAYQNHSVLELRFSDYQPLEAIQIPHRIERYIQGNSIDVTTLSTVSAGITSDQFLQ